LAAGVSGLWIHPVDFGVLSRPRIFVHAGNVIHQYQLEAFSSEGGAVPLSFPKTRFAVYPVYFGFKECGEYFIFLALKVETKQPRAMDLEPIEDEWYE
jgi:hypothetical protein